MSEHTGYSERASEPSVGLPAIAIGARIVCRQECWGVDRSRDLIHDLEGFTKVSSGCNKWLCCLMQCLSASALTYCNGRT